MRFRSGVGGKGCMLAGTEGQDQGQGQEPPGPGPGTRTSARSRSRGQEPATNDFLHSKLLPFLLSMPPKTNLLATAPPGIEIPALFEACTIFKSKHEFHRWAWHVDLSVARGPCSADAKNARRVDHEAFTSLGHDRQHLYPVSLAGGHGKS